VTRPPTPNIEISTETREGGRSLPKPTLPNPSRGLKSGLPFEEQPKPLLDSVRDVASAVCLIFAGVLAVWAGVIFRFSHPEFTETQLFLGAWPAITAIAVLLLLTAVLRGER
jgi:hypothetical protein